MSRSSLLVNLSALMEKPTGISAYTRNLLPQLKPIGPTVLSNQQLLGLDRLPIPSSLSPEYGLRGHVRRLFWLQTAVPRIYQALDSRLIFSPLPEAPLYSGCRFVITVHDLIPLRFPRPRSPLTIYFRHVVPHIVKRAVHIVANSHCTARDIERFYKINPNKITTIPLAYDRENFTVSSRSGQPVEARYFIYIGRQDAYKNIGRLISAFTRIALKTDTQLWLVGPFDKRYTPQLLAQVRELDMVNRVRFLDYVAYEALPNLLAGAIALVFPTLWEGFGLPALEAMACGTPVITSNISSLPEVVGNAAILIDPRSVDELAIAMEAVSSNASLRSAYRQAGLARANLFSWEKTGQETVEVLKRFL
ncbi:MAG: glycosyltransferase family 1 protein [Cyanobacteria bacterium P01_D01_bin.1]